MIALRKALGQSSPSCFADRDTALNNLISAARRGVRRAPPRYDLAAVVLAELSQLEIEIRKCPHPPACQPWTVRDHAGELKHGPRYLPN